MSVWFVAPSKRTAEEIAPRIEKWLERGYCVMLQRDPGERVSGGPLLRTLQICKPYEGYGHAVNLMCREVIDWDKSASWIVTGGDDCLPDPNHTAEEIAEQCSSHFADQYQLRMEKAAGQKLMVPIGLKFSTFGVMQPTGDRWGECADAHDYVGTGGACRVCGRAQACDQHLHGAYCDRSAVSPWIGREFARRMYGGRGPMCEEYWHMFDDTELQHVAIKYDVFWQRPDLIHYHEHWGRPKPGQKYGDMANMPKFLEKANSAENWRKSKELFERRMAEGWPGSEPIA